ncbi:ATP-binding cassette domain-containing protein [Mesorhizobium sp.]|uniref:ATP-binding cassette domain-containing protein n=1 Tax=Mesorhizobium sp. TaxID=1871066 RepID=UPI000FE9FC47|nr:ATP-binding cassette domain-containing protein [Mesorhizobium sp.]RWE75216.1 MAG: sugar ABC transporter ATP-binding protein [Mesorhizobium sp.]
MAEPLIRMANIRKSYGRVQALVDANFHVNEKEIVGLLGDNGAGKSTLIKVLSGAVPLTSGDIFVRGKKVNFRSTSDAIAEGIETIYQDSALVTQLSIARAMHFDSDLIILDEPTNNLGVAETQGVLSFVRSARDSGHSCIFIAHNIHHVFQVVDRIVVMRRGKVVADDIDPKKTTVAEVERVITGMSDKEIRDAISDGRDSHG